VVAKKVAGVAGSAAGGFAGGFFNNPGLIAIIGIIAAIGIPLLIFRKNIADFFSGGIQLPDINLPSINLPDITFPSFDFEFPSFEFPEITFPSVDLPDIGGVLGSIGETITQAAGTVLNPQDAPTTESEGTAVDFTESGMAAARGERGGATDEALEDAIEQDFGVTVAPTLLDSVIAPFTGGGPSFEGGTIFETPIEFLSLSQIIDRFMVSATEAASIRAEAIGFTESEEAFLSQGDVDVGGFVAGGPAAVSDPAFEGLSLEEIALRLTGGNISNF